MSNIVAGIIFTLIIGILSVVVIVAGAILGALMSIAFPIFILFTVGCFLGACYEEHKKETKNKKQ